MKLGKLGFTGNNIQSRTDSLGIYRPETNCNIQHYNGELDSYTYSGKALDLNSTIGGFTHVTCMVMSVDGDKIFIVKNGTSNDVNGVSTGTKIIYQINLSTRGDISTGSVSSSLSLPDSIFFPGGGTRNPQISGIYFKPDGSKLYVLTKLYSYSSNTYSESKIFQFNNSVSPWTISSYTYENISCSIPKNTQSQSPSASYVLSGENDLYFDYNGTAIFIVSDGYSLNTDTYDTDSVQKLKLSVPWDLSSIISTSDFYPRYTVPISNLNAINFKPDFTRYYPVNQTSNAIYQYNLSTTGTFKNGSTSPQSFDLYDYSTNGVNDVIFKSDGSSYYFCNNTGFIFQLSTNSAWNVQNSYSSGVVRLDLNSQTTSASSCFFGDSGYKLYVFSTSLNEIEQYSLSTAYDISTATSSTRKGEFYFSHNAFYFNSSGSKLFLVSISENSIYQHNLDTNWDVSTAKFVPIKFWYFTSTIKISPVADVFFGDNGSKLFLLTFWQSGTDPNSGYGRIIRIDLATAWDITTGTVHSSSDVPGDDFNQRAFTINPNGNYFYYSRYNNREIRQGNLSSVWTITGITYNAADYLIPSVPMNVGVWDPIGMNFSPSGDRFTIIVWDNSLSNGQTTGPVAYQQKLKSVGTAFQIKDYEPDNENNQWGYLAFNIGTENGVKYRWTGFKYGSNGYKVYLLSDKATGKQLIRAMDLVTPYRLTFNSWAPNSGNYQNFLINVPNITFTDFYFKDDGTKIYLVSTNSDTFAFNLGTAWDITTIQTQMLNLSTTILTFPPVDIHFKPDDTEFFLLKSNTLYKYQGSSPYNIENFAYADVSISLTDSPNSFYFKQDGSKLYTSNSSTGKISEYSLSTNWDITNTSSPTNSNIINFKYRISSSNSLKFNNSGSNFYIIHNNSLLSFPLSPSWSLSSFSYPVGTLDIYSQTTNEVNGLFFKPDLTKLYFIDFYQIFEYTASNPNLGNISQYVFNKKTNLKTKIASLIVSTYNPSYVAPSNFSLTSLFFKSDGSKLYLFSENGYYNELIQLNLVTNWDVDSANFCKVQSLSEISPFFETTSLAVDLEFSSTGDKIFIVYGSNSVFEIPLTTAWEIDSIDYYNVRFRENIFNRSDNSKIKVTNDEFDYRITEDTPNSIVLNQNTYPNMYFTGRSIASTIYQKAKYSYPLLTNKNSDVYVTKIFYNGDFSGYTGSSIGSETKNVGLSLTNKYDFDTFYVAFSNGKIHQFEIIKN